VRVLLTLTGPPGTGSGTVAEAVLDELGRQGHEAWLFYPDVAPEAGGEPPSGDPRHRVWRFPLRRGEVELPTFPKMIPDPHPREVGPSLTCRDLSHEALELYLEGAREALGRVAAELAPDAVECHHLWAVTWAAADLGLPYVAVPHHSDQMGYRYDARMRPYAARAAMEAARVLPISEFVRREVLELYPLPEDRVTVLHPGYDQDVFRPRGGDRAAALAAAGLAPDPPDAEPLPLVTFSGKISHTKGVDVLLRANRRVQAARPVRLVVAGTGSLGRAFGDGQWRGFELERVELPGHLPQPVLAGLHDVAAASVVPSREEGFGVAALEAMGCGCPLVASRTGGLPEFAVGELVEPEDEAALADALLRLLDQPPEEARELRRRARDTALRYSWRRIVERRVEIYREAVAA
jgi:glycosyltransferase involved in cell wall biosynthesis